MPLTYPQASIGPDRVNTLFGDTQLGGKNLGGYRICMGGAGHYFDADDTVSVEETGISTPRAQEDADAIEVRPPSNVP